jgi:hypothetical protein
LATVPPVDAEVCIRGEKYGVALRFSHANETGIGETHGQVSIFSHQRKNAFHLLGKVQRG